MPRWSPGAPERLVLAALELFAERGYDATTVADIARQAGLTKSTFFRHYSDKREVLFGRDDVVEVLVDSIDTALPDKSATQVVADAVDAVARTVFTEERRALVTSRRQVIAAHPELQEREALKGLAQVSAMTDALTRRGFDDITARVTADLGALVLRVAYEWWCDSARAARFPTLARRARRQVGEAAARASSAPVPR